MGRWFPGWCFDHMKRPAGKISCVAAAILFLSLFFPVPSHAQPPDDVTALIDQYTRLYREGRYQEAIPIAEKVMSIQKTTLGPEHRDTAVSLNFLAVLYEMMGDYARAISLCKRSLSIREKIFGPDHPDTAVVNINLGRLYDNTGEYAKAELLFKRAIAIYEKAPGPEHPNMVGALHSLAVLYDSMADYARAEPLYKRTIAIHEKTLGPEHPNTAISLNNLAMLYRDMGNYVMAESSCLRALAIYEKTLGPEHPNTAACLNNMASLYETMGDYARAESLCKRSLDIREKVLGPDHLDTAVSLNLLAGLYETMGDYARAEQLYMRSLAIREKVLGPEHRYTAAALNNLAEFYRARGDYTKSKYLYERSLAIYENKLGVEHPDTGIILGNLGELYSALSDHTKAEPLYMRSLAIKEKALGRHHPETAQSLSNLGVLHAATGRYNDSFPLMLRAQGIDAGLIDQVMGFTSEDRKMKFLATKEGNLHTFLSLIALHFTQDKGATGKALTVWLQRKGVVLEAQKRFQDALAISDDPKVMEKAQELARIRGQLSKLTFSGPGKEGAEAYRKKIKELEEQKERLEAELSRMSDAFAKTKKVGKADTKQVASPLPRGSALLDFVKLPIFNFAAKGREAKWLPARYYAFVLPAGKPDSVSLVDLGDAGEIDRLVADLRKAITNYEADPRGRDSSRISRRLHDIVFAPVGKDLKDVKEIYISPDGNLNLIPFEILKGPDGKHLIEDYTFNYLGSGRDLLGFGMVKGVPSKPLVIGDPDYDLDETGQKDSLRKLGIGPGTRSVATRSRDMSSKEFVPLPGTKEEVESIVSLLGQKDTSLYTGRDALEEVLMRQKDPKVLHLATHGFFMTDQDLLDEKGAARYENPLVRSGIVLAGANRSMKTGSDEGIVTAEKILSLRLHGTDVVVLSACETGLGDIKSGEGVFGLRRAFTQAGTKGLVMSLWSVPDKETKELMVSFYTNVFVKKMKRPEALRQAVLAELAEVKKRYGTTNPFFWGAFVYLGEP